MQYIIILLVCILQTSPPLSLSVCVYPLSIHIPADWLHETSFVEEPSSELTVREGDTLQVPCVINTAVDTNLSQVYWSGPQGLITSIDARDRPEMACEQNDIADRVFYIQMATRVSSDGGTLVQVSLNLHVCNAEQQDGGVYRCGVWTGNGRGEFKSMFLTVESTLKGISMVTHKIKLKSCD